MIGRVVSHYRIDEEIGRGGMGVVYRGYDLRLDRPVALKFLPSELTGDEPARERFAVEARAASKLDHSSVCTIHDIDETDDGQLFIVMAYYEGETLKDRLARGRLAIQECLGIAGQVASGLQRAHENGIVHRDVKPANLILTPHGEVKILDFGVAKLVDEAGITRTGAALGTMSYMSPEQLEGAEVSYPTDLWALGVVLHEMLTGSPPFGGGDGASPIGAILSRDPPPPGSMREDVPEALDHLVAGLLAKDPSARPSAAGAVRELEALSVGERRPEAETRRLPIGLAAGAVAALVLLGIVLPALGRARVDAAREAMSRAEALVQEQRFLEAFEEVEAARGSLEGDTALERITLQAADVLSLRSDPPGARVSLVTYGLGEDGRFVPEGEIEPRELGATPLVDVVLPRGSHLITLTLEGYEPVERLLSSVRGRVQAAPTVVEGRLDLAVELHPTGDVSNGMVPVPGGEYTLVSADAPAGATAELDAFFIDRFEVTNAEYQEFVQAGGYAQEEYWPSGVGHPGVPLVDRTGLPGPRSWSNQRFPDGEDRHPVASVTWLEADAYCRWRGGGLPTLFEWEKAARDGNFVRRMGMEMPWGPLAPAEPLTQRANFDASSTVPVDAHPLGQSPYGAYGMAGNVREWTSTGVMGDRIAMGGSWQDPSYVFPQIAVFDELTASAALGFRCVVRPGAPPGDQGSTIDLARRTPSYEPVDEGSYRSFLDFYRYDPVDLDPQVVETVETADWTRETVRLNGVGDDRILGYFFRPKRVEPPFQTLVLVPGITAFFSNPMPDLTEWLMSPHVLAGRAVFSVVMEGMIGRPFPPGTTIPASNSVGFRDLMVRHANELSIGVDYLAARGDVDLDRLVYFGQSWGAGSRSVFAAVDPRWDAAVFIGAGIDERIHPTLPEALNVNFLPYLDVPKLVVNGRQDEEHPWLTRGLPFWELLTEPKELVLLDREGHIPSPEGRVAPINDFLDRWLGPPR